MWFEREGRVYVSMPGVPYEMRGMMRAPVLPMLRERFKPPTIVHRTVKTTGMGETQLAERIAAWESALVKEGIRLADPPSPGLVKLRLSTYAGPDPAETAQRVDRQVKVLYGFDPRTHLRGGRNVGGGGGRVDPEGPWPQTLALAESCTGDTSVIW